MAVVMGVEVLPFLVAMNGAVGRVQVQDDLRWDGIPAELRIQVDEQELAQVTREGDLIGAAHFRLPPIGILQRASEFQAMQRGMRSKRIATI